MSLTKVIYTDGESVIHADNLNEIQDNIILNAENIEIKVNKIDGCSLVPDTKVAAYDSHIANTSNPHNVTASQLSCYTKSESDSLLNAKCTYKALGSVNDFIRVVIALCQTSVAKTGLDSYSDGKIFRQRHNGLVPMYGAFFDFDSQYAGEYLCNYSLITNYNNTSTAAISGDGYRACIFTYNGIHYAGLEFYQTQASSFHFIGAGNFSPFMIGYYNQSSGAILNEEIYNSLSYSAGAKQSYVLV